jgi:aminomethyltransferase
LAAIRCAAKGAPPRAGYAVLDAHGTKVGTLSSGALSPTLGVGIGMAYLPPALAAAGTALAIEVRGRPLPACVVKKPFYKPGMRTA